MKTLKDKFLLFLFSILLSNFYLVSAANYYWVGGTGNWSDYGNHWTTTSGGLIFHTTIPGPSDDVFFDFNSFAVLHDTVYVDSTLVYCKNMTWSGALNNPVIKSKITGNEVKIFGSLVMIQAMQNLVDQMSFESTVPGNTITTGGQFFYGMLFNGTGSWILMDPLNGWYVELYRGSLNTNSQAINCQYFESIFNNIINLQLGTSIIHVYEWTIQATTINLVAPTSTIIASNTFSGGTNNVYGDITSKQVAGNNCTFHDISLNKPAMLYGNNSIYHQVSFNDDGKINGSGNTFQKVVFYNNATVADSNTFDSLIFTKQGCVISLKKTQTINNLFSANGSCSGLTIIQSTMPGVKATIKKATGSVILDYVLLQDIKANGGASFIANNSINNGNVSGITINSPASQNLYWIGGTGNWGDMNHWADSSGGIGGTCVPSPFDNVFFDSNSFQNINDTVYQDGKIDFCNNMDWTGSAYSPVFINTDSKNILKVYGSFILYPGVNFNLNSLNFESDSSGNTISSSGCQLNAEVNFEGSGSWSLADSFQTSIIHLDHGSLNSNNQDISVSLFYGISNSITNLKLGTSVIHAGEWRFNSANVSLDADSCFIFSTRFYSGFSQFYNEVTTCEIYADSSVFNSVTVFNNGIPGPDPCSINGNHSVFYHSVFIDDAEITGLGNIFHYASFMNGLRILNNNTFDSMLFNNTGVVIELNGTLTINNLFFVSGSCKKLTTIGPALGNQAVIYKNSGSVVIDYVLINNVIAMGGAGFIANNSVSNGNVNGWTINSSGSQNFYWIGGSGNWSDTSHWALVSGGVPGTCIPGPIDSVFFDVNSFSQLYDTVYQDMSLAYCKYMDWSGAINYPVIKNSLIDNIVKIFGSVKLISGMNNMMRNITFASNTPGNFIASDGQKLNGNTIFEGNGDYIFSDSTDAWDINLIKGTLNTNSQYIHGHSISISNINSILQLGSSVINCSKWYSGLSQLLINAPNSVIICPDFTSGQGQTFGDVYGNISATNTTFHDIYIGDLDGSNSIIHHAYFYGNDYLNGSGNVYQKAVFNGDVSFNGSNTFDTLIFNNAGGNVDIRFTQTVNNSLYTNATPGFPISIGNVNPVFQPTISSPPGITICLDNLYIHNLTASGGATFYAGDHSVDLGNNTGWLWSSCTPDTSNVWPGDANYDLTADNIDLLYIGLAYGYTGPTRVGASTNWVAQPGIDWLQQFATGYNIKHADCDGNGIVNAVDTNAVVLNYGLVHPFKQQFPPSPNNFGTDLYFDMPTTSLVPGSAVDIPIMFGTQNNPADKFYGVAFTVNYDPSFIQSNSMEISFDTTWFGNSSNTIHLTKDFYNNGSIDMGFVKTDHTDENGYGKFATLHFKVANNASGYLNLSFTKILVLDKFEITQPVNVINGSVFTGIENNSSQPGFNVYPNPANDQVRIDNHLHTIERIRIIDITGKIVSEINKPNNQIIIDVQPFKNGIYFIEVTSGKGIMRQKISIMH